MIYIMVWDLGSIKECVVKDCKRMKIERNLARKRGMNLACDLCLLHELVYKPFILFASVFTHKSIKYYFNHISIWKISYGCYLISY